MDKQALSVIYTNLDSALQKQVSALPDNNNNQRSIFPNVKPAQWLELF